MKSNRVTDVLLCCIHIPIYVTELLHFTLLCTCTNPKFLQIKSSVGLRKKKLYGQFYPRIQAVHACMIKIIYILCNNKPIATLYRSMIKHN